MNNRNIAITRIIKELGIPANVGGYDCVKYAVELMVNDPTLKKAITKSLYPMVATKFDITPMRAERLIRYAIKRGWSSAKAETKVLLFGHSVSGEKPKNGEFIVTVADYILSSEGNEG